MKKQSLVTILGIFILTVGYLVWPRGHECANAQQLCVPMGCQLCIQTMQVWPSYSGDDHWDMTWMHTNRAGPVACTDPNNMGISQIAWPGWPDGDDDWSWAWGYRIMISTCDMTGF